MAQREPAALQRRRLTAALLGRNPAATDTPTFDSWPDLWDSTARILGEQRQLLLDELPYATESDPAMLSLPSPIYQARAWGGRFTRRSSLGRERRRRRVRR